MISKLEVDQYHLGITIPGSIDIISQLYLELYQMKEQNLQVLLIPSSCVVLDLPKVETSSKKYN